MKLQISYYVFDTMCCQILISDVNIRTSVAYFGDDQVSDLEVTPFVRREDDFAKMKNNVIEFASARWRHVTQEQLQSQLR